MEPTLASTSPKLEPGEYPPDLAFTCIEDWPKPKIIKEHHKEVQRTCPGCGKPAPRVRMFTRPLHDVHDLV